MSGTTIAASDGSLKDGHGGAGWELAVKTGDLTSTNIHHGSSPVNGSPESSSSTRCELGGIVESTGKHVITKPTIELRTQTNRNNGTQSSRVRLAICRHQSPIVQIANSQP